MHINYIIVGISLLFGKILGKRESRIITIFILILYILIIGVSPSILRASTMGIVMLLSRILYKNNNVYNVIAISLLINLIYNPYSLLAMDLQLSYLGTLGIIIFYKNINDIIKKIITNRRFFGFNKKLNDNTKAGKILNKSIDILIMTISAQIFILPILILNSNIIGTYSFIVNIIVRIFNWPNNNFWICICFFKFFYFFASKIFI